MTLNWYYIHNIDLQGWKYNPPSSENPLDSFAKFLPDGVTVTYIPGCSQILVSFSASRVANGHNCFEYSNNEYDIVKEKIEMAIYNATGMHLNFEDGLVSRFDVYSSFVFSTLGDCKAFIKWLQDQPIIGKYQKLPYTDNGEWRWFEGGLVFKAYIKNEDPHLPQEIRDILPPTVRLEVECRKGFRRKLLGKKVTANILKYPAIWLDYYKTALDKFKLNGTIVKKRTLHKKIEQVLRNENLNVRKTTIAKYTDAVERFLQGDDSTRTAAVRIINKLYEQGVCPFPLKQPSMLLKGTLSAVDVLSATEQKHQELCIASIQKMIVNFKECIIKKEKSKCETITYSGYIFPLSTGQYRLVPIRDSS
jgi:hypothetical protein